MNEKNLKNGKNLKQRRYVTVAFHFIGPLVESVSNSINNYIQKLFYKKMEKKISDDFEYKKEILNLIEENKFKNKKELIDFLEFEVLLDQKCELSEFMKIKRIKEYLSNL